MFAGTRPECELALYTVCYEAVGPECHVKVAGQSFIIQTNVFFETGKIRTAFPAMVPWA